MCIERDSPFVGTVKVDLVNRYEGCRLGRRVVSARVGAELHSSFRMLNRAVERRRSAKENGRSNHPEEVYLKRDSH